MIKVSVVIPVYNVQNYIERCIRSLFEQTLDSIEYIFIDDYSSDKSIDILLDVLKEYPARERYVKLFRNEKNLGQAGTRKRGIQMANGDFVIHCDPDDWVELDMYEILYNKAIKENADLVWCNYYKNFEDGRQVESLFFDKETDKVQSIFNLVSEKKWGCLWSHMVKRRIAQSSLIIWPTWNLHEDLYLVVQYTNLADKLTFLDRCLYHYFYNKEGIVATKNNHDKLSDTIMSRIFAYSGISEICLKDCRYYQSYKYCLSVLFRAKDSLFAMCKTSSEAMDCWISVPPTLTMKELLKSDLRFLTKIYNSIIILGFFPFVNRFIDIKKRLS